MVDLTSLSDNIGQTQISQAIQSHEWVVPAIQSIHILGIAAIMASIAMLNLRLAGLIGRHQSVQAMARVYLPWMWWALPVMLVTGSILIIGEPARELLNSFFWYKMAMLLAVVLLTIPLTHLLEDRPFGDLPPAKRSRVRGMAVLSLLLWCGIVFCGRWIAYS